VSLDHLYDPVDMLDQIVREQADERRAQKALPQPDFAGQYQREFTAHQRTLETLRSTEAELTRTRTLLNDERAGRELQANPGTDIPFATLAFPGGEVTIPTPTRADLILSAKQWATAIREPAEESLNAIPFWQHSTAQRVRELRHIISCCERIEKALTSAATNGR